MKAAVILAMMLVLVVVAVDQTEACVRHGM